MTSPEDDGKARLIQISGAEAAALGAALTDHDIKQLNEGRITETVAAFQAALADLKTLTGHDDEE